MSRLCKKIAPLHFAFVFALVIVVYPVLVHATCTCPIKLTHIEASRACSKHMPCHGSGARQNNKQQESTKSDDCCTITAAESEIEGVSHVGLRTQSLLEKIGIDSHSFVLAVNLPLSTKQDVATRFSSDKALLRPHLAERKIFQSFII